MTRYGMPYIFEDTTGRLTGSEFADIHERLRFNLALDFGPNNGLGTVSVASVPMPMRKYLYKNPMGSSKVRRFVASDGQTYQWSRRTQPNQEWTCTNANNYVIASYSLKAPGEPEYSNSSGCILEIAEQFEMIASLWIMRHIQAYDLA
ncbi:hypothetical protein R3P38DRAFT_3004348 [Favolaschia claudopus]|uniref:DUF6593 domain-containing protein n=1 Tax=Favolaschia claudopus TaxID=2862362 RepID=A0AAW0ALL0_9AGAR